MFVIKFIYVLYIQKFILTVTSLESNTDVISITNLEPQFIIQEPPQGSYKIVISAFNEKGQSEVVTINQEDIMEKQGKIIFIIITYIIIFNSTTYFYYWMKKDELKPYKKHSNI